MTENLDQQNTKKCPDAVDHDILFGGTSAGYKGLMKFIGTGKSNAEYSCKNQQKDSSYTVNIKWK